MSEWDALLDEPLDSHEYEWLSARGITPCTPGAVGLLLAFREGFDKGKSTGYDDGYEEARQLFDENPI